MQEINEFFSYAETEHLGSKRAAFEASFDGSSASRALVAVQRGFRATDGQPHLHGRVGWVSASSPDKEAYLRTTLDELTSPEQPARIAAASALCYVLSGKSQ